MSMRTIMQWLLWSICLWGCTGFEMEEDDDMSGEEDGTDLVVSCKDAIGGMYDVGCEIFCERNEEEHKIFINTCAWYSGDAPVHYTVIEAIAVCELIKDTAAENECSDFFDKTMSCLESNTNDCASYCSERYDNLIDCIYPDDDDDDDDDH